jgi:hypothetical protein
MDSFNDNLGDVCSEAGDLLIRIKTNYFLPGDGLSSTVKKQSIILIENEYYKCSYYSAEVFRELTTLHKW